MNENCVNNNNNDKDLLDHDDFLRTDMRYSFISTLSSRTSLTYYHNSIERPRNKHSNTVDDTARCISGANLLDLLVI